MKKLPFLIGAFAVAAMLNAGPALAETTLKAIAFIPKTHPVMWGSRAWTDEINAAMEGELKIDYVGGPEIVPRFEQHEAVRNGVLDMAFIVGNDLQDRIPEAQGMVLSRLNPTQERESGFFDYLDGLFQERMNTKLIGRMQMSAFYLWTNIVPTKLADLKGLKMRTAALYDRLMKHYGMIPVAMNSPEVYTALERGVVDGFGWPNTGVVKLGWAKHIKAAIDLPFFEWSNLYAVMNLDKWNGLSADTQQKLMDITIAFEPKMVAYYRGQEAKEWEALTAAGVQRVKFSDAENEDYIANAYGLEWASLEGKIGAEAVAHLKTLTGN